MALILAFYIHRWPLLPTRHLRGPCLGLTSGYGTQARGHMDPEVAAAAQAGHWSDPCEVCMWHTGTTSRGGEAAASQGVPRAPARQVGLSRGLNKKYIKTLRCENIR